MSRIWHELLIADHQITEQVFEVINKACASPNGPTRTLIADILVYLNEYVDACHNYKEELCLFPLLEQRGIPRHGGPLAVMLDEHEQSKRLLSRVNELGKSYASGDLAILGDLAQTFEEYTTLVKNHYWKENDILFKMAQNALTEIDAEAVTNGILKVEAKLGPDTRERYYALAERIIATSGLDDLSFSLDRSTIAAILNTLPIELSFVDANDTVRYFSHENLKKIFTRTRGVVGAQVQNCHPRKSINMVNTILADFKSGKRHHAAFWIELDGRFIHIRYYSVRDSKGGYLGCLEVVQDVTEIRALTGEKRLLDDESN